MHIPYIKNQDNNISLTKIKGHLMQNMLGSAFSENKSPSKNFFPSWAQ